MKTYRIVHEPTKTDILTTDWLDVMFEIDKAEDKTTIQVTVEEMTAKQYEEKLKLNGIQGMTIKTPYTDER